MKVIFAYPFCGLGGVETLVLTRAEALRARAIDADVVFSELYGQGGTTFPDSPHVRLGLDAPAIARLALEAQADVVVAIDYADLVDALGAVNFPGAVVFETHTSHIKTAKRFYRAAANALVRRIVVPSAFNAMRIFALGIDNGHVSLVPNPIDIGTFSPRTRRELETGFGPLPPGPVLLWIGRIEPEKNPVEFLELAAEVMSRRLEVTAILVGDSPGRPQDLDGVKASLPQDLRGRFRFYPHVPHSRMPLYYSLAGRTGGCLVSSSRSEAVPMILLEAAGCGCPVLATRVGGVEELIVDGMRGLLYDQGDLQMGLQRLEEILSDRRSAAQRAANALRYVRERHAADNSAESYARVLESMVAHMGAEAALGAPGVTSRSVWLSGHLRATAETLNRGNRELEQFVGVRAEQDPS